MKKILSIALASVMALSLVACGGSSGSDSSASTTAAAAAADSGEAAEPADISDAASDPSVSLVYAEVNSETSIDGMVAMYFKEQVEELSGGSINIDLQLSGVLGSENDVLDSLMGGASTIDIARISAFALGDYGCDKARLLNIPYTWNDRDHYWNFAMSDLAEEFLNEPQEIGIPIRGLFYGEEGFRHFFTINPVESIDDLKGMKLRVSNDAIMNGLVNALGASPTVVSYGELYSALQTGVVDGAEQPIVNYRSESFNEVAPNLILDGHTLGAIQIIISDSAWDKLTPAQQQVIKDAAEMTQEYNKTIAADQENEALEALKADGCNVVEVPDLTPWKDACADLTAQFSAGYEDLYQQLLDFAN